MALEDVFSGYRRGDTGQTPGQPAPLPQGEASQLNDAAGQVQAQPGMAAPAPMDMASMMAAAGGAPGTDELHQPTDDFEKFLLRPTDRPDEPVTHGMTDAARMSPPPAAALMLPVLNRLAASSPNLRVIRDLILRGQGQPITPEF